MLSSSSLINIHTDPNRCYVGSRLTRQGRRRAISSSQTSVQTKIITRREALKPYAEEWDRLVFSHERSLPQAAYSYVSSQIDHLQPADSQWCCIAAIQDNTLVGMLPFVIRKYVMPHRGTQLWTNPLDAEMIVLPGQEDVVVPALLGRLDDAAPGWRSLEFHDLRDYSATVAYCERFRGPILMRPAGQSAYIPLEGTYEDFLNKLTKSFRRNLRRVSKKFFALPGAQMEFVTADEARPEHLAQFIEVEGSGWKAREGNAIRLRPELTAYYQDATTGLARSGVLEWHRLLIGERVIASNLAVRMGNKLVLDKIGYDESWSEYAPGNILISAAIERAFNDGSVREVDFISDNEWNRRWQAKSRNCYNISIYRRSPTGIALGYLPRRIQLRIQSSDTFARIQEKLRNLKSHGASDSPPE